MSNVIRRTKTSFCVSVTRESLEGVFLEIRRRVEEKEEDCSFSLSFHQEAKKSRSTRKLLRYPRWLLRFPSGGKSPAGIEWFRVPALGKTEKTPCFEDPSFGGKPLAEQIKTLEELASDLQVLHEDLRACAFSVTPRRENGAIATVPLDSLFFVETLYEGLEFGRFVSNSRRLRLFLDAAFLPAMAFFSQHVPPAEEIDRLFDEAQIRFQEQRDAENARQQALQNALPPQLQKAVTRAESTRKGNRPFFRPREVLPLAETLELSVNTQDRKRSWNRARAIFLLLEKRFLLEVDTASQEDGHPLGWWGKYQQAFGSLPRTSPLERRGEDGWTFSRFVQWGLAVAMGRLLAEEATVSRLLLEKKRAQAEAVAQKVAPFLEEGLY